MSRDICLQFAKKLKEIRKERSLSQESLALMCGIDRTYIGRIENLKRNPSLAILYKIAKGLGMKLSELLEID